MAKKLFVVWLLITMVIFSSISIYATEQTQGRFFYSKDPVDKKSMRKTRKAQMRKKKAAQRQNRKNWKLPWQ